MCIYMEGSWDIPNTDSGPGKSKWLAKGNLKEMPHNTKSNYHKGVTQWLSWARLCVCPHELYSFFPPKKYFTLFHYFLSLWKFFSAKLRGQGPCHWPLVQWLGFNGLTATTWPQSLAGNWSFSSSCCRPPEIKGQLRRQKLSLTPSSPHVSDWALY